MTFAYPVARATPQAFTQIWFFLCLYPYVLWFFVGMQYKKVLYKRWILNWVIICLFQVEPGTWCITYSYHFSSSSLPFTGQLPLRLIQWNTFRRRQCLRTVTQLLFLSHCHQENNLTLTKLMIYQITFLFSLDLRSGTLRFSNMKYFMSDQDDERLSSIISSMSCLVMVVETDTTEEASQLMDFMNGIHVKRKHLHVQLSSGLEIKELEKKNINFNVVVDHLSSGSY